ncbi:MAG: ribosomal RNA small subunit methyltransferase A [Planctomycetaceae bacterium]|nr:ribosomal RNA small subunit methyltransferase A [Planctomycetaceae bacterium]
MTTFMALRAASVVSVEIDSNMYALASEAVGEFDNVTLLNCDALKTKNAFAAAVLDAVSTELAKGPDRRLKLIANLPYAVATPVISNLVATELPWERIVATIQLELANRMAARPKTSAYGALSVWLQSQCRVKTLKRLAPTVFWPRPKVNSAIVRLKPNPKKRKEIVDREFFHDFVRRAFTHRRKLLRSVLVAMYRKQLSKPQVDEILAEVGLGEQARAEALPPALLVKLANRFFEAIHTPGADADR